MSSTSAAEEPAEIAQRIAALGDVALDLCDNIIRQRTQGRNDNDSGGGTELGRVVRP